MHEQGEVIPVGKLKLTEHRSLMQNNLAKLFPAGDIYAVSDDEWMRVAAAHYGLRPVSLDAAESLPPSANVVLFLRNQRITAEERKNLIHTRVLVVPIASFDSSLEAALYTQKLVTLTDYDDVRDQTAYWADRLRNEDGALVFSSSPYGDGTDSGTQLVCRLAENLRAEAWTDSEIGVGDWISIGTICEFSLTAPSTKDWYGAFVIDGCAVTSGVLVARDGRCTEAGDARIRSAHRLRDEMTANGPISLRIENGILTSARGGGADFTETLLEATNPEYGLHVLELGIGTNKSVLPYVNWSVNSQLNEGAGPVHIGFGEGVTGAHIDFIVQDAEHDFKVLDDSPSLTFPESK
jgi:hypothetical protein